MQNDQPAKPEIGPKVAGGAARPPKPVTMQGRYTVVRPLVPSVDAASLFEGTHREDREKFWLYMSSGPFANVDEFRAFLEKLGGSADPLSFVIADVMTGRALGHASYMRITPEHRVIEVGNIFLTHWLARTRAATEAMYLMARHVFEDLGYRRYEWKCNAFNLPSRRAAVRLGFSYEGTFMHHMIQKGRSRDTAWYSMLDSEWPMYKAAYEEWLSPDNFDVLGNAKRRLATLLRPARS
jgi:RimJ/RimL family protein N-acetyltransferase